MDGFSILHSVHPIPGESERFERNESVGVILDPCMGESWRDCSKVWNPVSSRIVTARQKICNMAWKRGPGYGVMVSVYAPYSWSQSGGLRKDLQSVVDAEDVLG